MSHAQGSVVTHARDGNHLGSVAEGEQIHPAKDRPAEEHRAHMGAPRKGALGVGRTEFTSCLCRGGGWGRHFGKANPVVEKERGPPRTPEQLLLITGPCSDVSLPRAVPRTPGSPVEEARPEGEFLALTIFWADLSLVKESRVEKMRLPASRMSGSR